MFVLYNLQVILVNMSYSSNGPRRAESLSSVQSDLTLLIPTGSLTVIDIGAGRSGLQIFRDSG